MADKSIPGCKITANEATHRVLKQNSLINNVVEDISIIYVKIILRDTQHQPTLSLLSHYDRSTKLTGMSKMTAFVPAFTVKILLERNESPEYGIIYSHELFTNNEVKELFCLLEKNNVCDIYETHQFKDHKKYQ